ncbi:hypothetical protein WJX81_003204 [Elliptochloris bilobata]|uniref:SGNH hydrolase-type esterase domain-containing protein n=1 Tax=Elliptochloris bilobata TaxID=381761 RepID=A0AAW1QYZ9_9CHLO
MDPEFDDCNGVKYEDQGWYKLEVPMYKRAPVGPLQQLAVLLPLLDDSTGVQPAPGNTTELLERVFDRPLRFHESELARSVSHAGDASRLRLTLGKLLRGEPISVVILGGSIDIGADLDTAHDAYFVHVSEWISRTFPTANGSAHTFHNAARASTGSPYYASCLHDQVPQEDADLVFLEFDVNDNVQTPYMNNGHRRSLEVLMRKLLQFPNHPAVVYLHWWSPSLNQGQRSFWNHTVQPESGLLASYYGLPALSARDVFFQRWARNDVGFRSRDFMCNQNHPNYLGHQYMADLVIGFLQSQLAATALFPPTPADAARAALPLPEPMLPGNFETRSLACLRDEALRDAARQSGPGGFQWVDDLTHYGAHRWGWASTQPGETLEIKMDTRNPMLASPSMRVVLGVGVLMSYEGMGTGLLECVRGCHCAVTHLDCHWDKPMSIKEWWHMKVTQSSECVLRLTNAQATSSGGHKLKLEALTLRPAGVDALGLATGDSSEWFNHAHYRNRTSLYGEGVRGWRDGKPLPEAG